MCIAALSKEVIAERSVFFLFFFVFLFLFLFLLICCKYRRRAGKYEKKHWVLRRNVVGVY